MPLIDTNLKNTPKFLAESPEPHEKEIWKKVYAIYLQVTGKSAEEAKNERLKLATLLPILQSLDQKWKDVKSD